MKLKLPQSNKKESIKNTKLIIPPGFKLLIDTREQLPLFVDYDIPKISKALKDGDYSIGGFEKLFSIERKQVSDYFSYIGREFSKTRNKLQRLSEFEVAIFCVEASYNDLLSPQIYTKMTANHVHAFNTRLCVKYGIIPIYERDRKILERIILDCAVYYYKLKRGLR